MISGGKFETSLVEPLEALVALVKIQICQGVFKSGRFYGRPSVSPLIVIFLSGNRDMTKDLIINMIESFFNRT